MLELKKVPMTIAFGAGNMLEMVFYATKGIIKDEINYEVLDYCEWKNGFRVEATIGMMKGYFNKIKDMLLQLIPVGTRLALGSQKLFKMRFRPIKEAIDHINLRKYIIETTKAAYKVFIIFAAGIIALIVLRETNVIDDRILFLITVAFYVCDLICVLIWCPFRLIMHNRCCTTCRISVPWSAIRAGSCAGRATVRKST